MVLKGWFCLFLVWVAACVVVFLVGFAVRVVLLDAEEVFGVSWFGCGCYFGCGFGLV